MHMIPTWVLILSMAGTQGVAIAYVPFVTRAACVAAGEQWMNKTYLNIDKYTFRLITPNYICVSTQ
jgi:hypothetical protein